MDIAQFQKEIIQDRLQGYDDVQEWWVKDDLQFYVSSDGMLSCSFNDKLIPCEDEDWEKTLDIVADFIKAKRPIIQRDD